MRRREIAARYDIEIEPVTGDRLAEVLGDVARLRIAVFRDWPYLYDGTLEYERGYLAGLAAEPDALVVVARHREEIVGAATAAPLAGHTPEFAPLLAARGYDPERVFYCGESVLLPAYRGRGIGHAFFDRREAHALACRSATDRYTHATFCAVVRDPSDARVPSGYRPLEPFWRRRGYEPVEGLLGSYAWKEIGAMAETSKPMQFWMKAL